MLHRTSLLALLTPAVLLTACTENGDAPTAVADPHASMRMQHSMPGMTMEVVPLQLDPFTFRAPLDPYQIHQLPDFLMHSKNTTDIVIQRAVFQPGPGIWHTHPGPSFIYVIEGEIKLERVSKHGECTETPVHGPGKAYFEVANEVHRAVVVSATPAVLMVTRFNIPVGGAITIPAADPGC